jgi:hypothetical protein
MPLKYELGFVVRRVRLGIGECTKIETTLIGKKG